MAAAAKARREHDAVVAETQLRHASAHKAEVRQPPSRQVAAAAASGHGGVYVQTMGA